jgi:hypothetical protein
MWKLAFQGEYNIHLYGRVLVKNLIPSEYGYISMFCVATLALGSQARQGLVKVRAKREAPGDTFHAPGSAKECEGMNPHTPKGTPTLGVGVLVDSRIFKEQFQGSKLVGLKCFLYHWKALGT